MKKLKLLAILLVSNSMFAQEEDQGAGSILEPKVTFDYGIRVALPQRDFKDNYRHDLMGGAGLTVLFPISKHNPVDVGMDMAYFFMSKTEASYQYFDKELRGYNMNSEVSGSMIPLHLNVRIYPLKHKGFNVQPYIEGLGGVKIFSIDQTTETRMDGIDFELNSVDENHVTSAWSYGYGIGFKFRVSKNNLLYLNTKVSQLYGEETEYLNSRTFQLSDQGEYEHSFNRSKTDMLQFSVGLNLMIE